MEEEEGIPAEIMLKENLTATATTFFDRNRILLWDGWYASFAFFLGKKNSEEFAVENINTSPIKPSPSSFYSIVASCDGLVCVVDQVKNQLGSFSYSILLWNPLTGEAKRVPDPPIPIPPLETSSGSYGLGYDSSTDDYKLVLVTHGFTISNVARMGVSKPNEVAVFSLRTNTWRQIQHFPTTTLSTFEPGVFFNGALHWTGYFNDSPHRCYKVVSFCLEKEKYTLLDLPAGLYCPWRIFFIGIQILGDKLAVYYPSNAVGYFHLSFVNPSENSESWTEHAVTLERFGSAFIPLCLLENGEEVLFQGIGGGPVGVFSLTDGSLRYLHIHGLPNIFQAITFSESLISPNTFKGKRN